MHTSLFIKAYVVFLAVALALLPVVAFAGDATPVVAGQDVYRLPLDHGTNGLQFSEKATSMAADADLVSGSPPIISITIFEPSGAGPGALKWQYLFSPLSKGEEFVVQGRLYRLTGIYEGWLAVTPANRSTWKCEQKSCMPYVDVVRLSRAVSTAGRNALVVSQRGPFPDEPSADSSASLYTSIYGCFLYLSLDGLKQGPHGYIAHMRSKLNAIYHHGDISKCREHVHTGQVDAGVGDVLNFGDFGRFKVDSIWPANAHHKDWVILVPADRSSHESKGVTAPNTSAAGNI